MDCIESTEEEGRRLLRTHGLDRALEIAYGRVERGYPRDVFEWLSDIDDERCADARAWAAVVGGE